MFPNAEQSKANHGKKMQRIGKSGNLLYTTNTRFITKLQGTADRRKSLNLVFQLFTM